jgi:hypothetical protein
MFKSSEDDTTCASSSIISFLLNSLKPDPTTDDDSIQALFISEPFDVFSGMRIDVLQTLGEFIVQSVNEGNNGPTDFNDLAGLWIRGGIII